MNIKLLEKEFKGIGEVSNFRFKQLYKSKTAYLYELSGNSTSYEVIVRESVPICLDFKNRTYSDTEFKEVYPKSKHFGTKGWSFIRLNDAIDKFNSIT